LLLVLAASASAQTRRPPPAGPTPRAGSWELGGGAVYVAGFDLGESTAELTRNTTTGPGPFDLFTTSTELRSTVGVQGRIGYYFSPRLEVEGGMRYARPVLSIRISGDAEEAPDQTAEETLSQFVFDGSVLWHFTRPQASPSRVVPFVVGGAGYIRELHADLELVETGVEYHAGAGVKVWFGNARRRFGVRGEAGISIRDGGFDFEDNRRAVPIAAGSIIYLF
jgi:Outer membrane protein beta-barrel domain